MKYFLFALGLFCLLVTGCEVPTEGPPSPDTSDTGGVPLPPPDGIPSDTLTPPPEEPPEEEPPEEEPTPGEPSAQVLLPVRVVDLSPDIEERTVRVPNATGVDALWLRVHRPTYRDQQVNPSRPAKASVRINDGRWIDLTKENVTLPEPERKAGGLGGSMMTLRMAVPVDNVRSGENTLRFRYNGTDGLTVGYRVIDMNFLAGGKAVLPESAFRMEDPAEWEAPAGYASAQDIEAGRQAWLNAEIVESHAIGRDLEPLRSTCASCHAESGHDLKYFAFSNESIITRARFHGLSEETGKQIAAYIRSLPLETQNGSTYEPPGRPWDPPYQPEPGLSGRPVHEWAAGGGLDAVLPHDSLMWEHLEEDGSMIKAFAIDNEIEVYNQPIAIQMEDWNQWLPRFHPIDVFGDHFVENTDEIGEGDTWRDDVLGFYAEMRRVLDEQGAVGLTQGGNAMRKFGAAARKGYLDFLGGASHIQNEISIERAELALKKWALIKIWQEMQAHHLADDADVLYGEDAEERSWLTGDARVPFEIAPHISAANTSFFEWQLSPTIGNYQTTSWYQTQLILNAGNNAGGAIAPVDWNYQPMFVQSQGNHAARSTQTFAKMLQQFSDEDRPLRDVYVRQIHPGLYGPDGKYAAPFEDADPDRRAQAYTALLTALMDKLEAHSPAEWRAVWGRPDGTRDDILRPRSYTPQTVSNNINSALHGRDFQWADVFYTMIPRFASAGVARPVLERMVAWGNQMWPNGNWNGLSLEGAGKDLPPPEEPPSPEPPPGERGLYAEYFSDMTLTRRVATGVASDLVANYSGYAPVNQLPRNEYSLRFTGRVQAQTSGEVTFFAQADDGLRVWLDGEQIIDIWETDGPGQATITMQEGQLYELRVEFHDDQGSASFSLNWNLGEGRERIPLEALSH